MKLILHIGTHKTGTTSIQFTCAKNRGRLSKNGFYWARDIQGERVNQHSQLAIDFKKGKDDYIQNWFKHHIKMANKNKAHTFVLSGESFCHLPPEKVQAFKQFLPFDDIKILLYVRNIYDYTKSALNQRLRGLPMLTNISEFAVHIRESLDYDRIVTSWEETYGAEKVFVYSFDREKEYIIHHFLSAIDFPENEQPTLKYQENPRNVSIDMVTHQLLSAAGAYNRYLNQEHISRIYNDSFPVQIRHPLENEFIRLLIGDDIPAYENPKLTVFKEELLKKKDFKYVPGETDLNSYFNGLSEFLLKYNKKSRLRSALAKVTSLIKSD